MDPFRLLEIGNMALNEPPPMDDPYWTPVLAYNCVQVLRSAALELWCSVATATLEQLREHNTEEALALIELITAVHILRGRLAATIEEVRPLAKQELEILIAQDEKKGSKVN